MRTTLTLDDDVAALLERMRQEKSLTLKEAVNRALRLGLHEMRAEQDEQPFQTRTASLGRPLIDLDNIGEALAIAEGEDSK